MIYKDFILKKLKSQLKLGNVVFKIVALNSILYLLSFILNVFGLAFGFTEELMANYFSKVWFYVPSQFSDFFYKPFTLLTYQFLHSGFLHLLSNMLIVYYFGNIFISLTHKKKLLPLYLLGGVFSGVFYLIVFNSLDSLTIENIYLVGASGSAMAILAAVATIIPEREISLFRTFEIKHKWIAVFFLVINIISISSLFGIENSNITNSNIAGNIAHLGGLIFGFLFIEIKKHGVDLAQPVNKVINYFSAYFIKGSEPKISYVNEKFKSKKQFNPYKINKETEVKINAILDKIKESGYDKLTKAEKEFLFNNSNK